MTFPAAHKAFTNARVVSGAITGSLAPSATNPGAGYKTAPGVRGVLEMCDYSLQSIVSRQTPVVVGLEK